MLPEVAWGPIDSYNTRVALWTRCLPLWVVPPLALGYQGGTNHIHRYRDLRQARRPLHLPNLLVCRPYLHRVGDHPYELGNQVVKMFGRMRTTDGVILSVRFGGFRQGLLKPVRVSCRRFP